MIPTDKVEVGFKDIDAAILVGSMPRKEGMERKDLLKANVNIFKTQGAALDTYAKKTVKVTLQSTFFFLNIFIDDLSKGIVVLAKSFFCFVFELSVFQLRCFY